ncbi:MAG TPA: amidohydrolase family protein [Egicoccus sp.]|nr:amidohydrolase family protein [Egicoccus sp.]HSK22948.1 amidohydrolase family protein [Egicoccus sp.]
MTTYDVHAHCAPNGLLELFAREGDRYGTELVDTDKGRAVRFAGGVTTPALRDDFDDVAARLASMDAARVEVQLISSWIDLTAYSLPTEVGTRYARMFNELLAATVAEHPDRFRGLCTVPLQDGAAAAAELRHAVTGLGMVGVEIATTVDGRDLDDPELEPFWAAASELRCPVVIHPYVSLTGRNVSRYFLGNLVGNPAESTIAIAHMLFSGVLDRHPDLRPVLLHGGGFAPWQSGRWDRGFDAVSHLSRKGGIETRPTELLRRIHFDTVLHDPKVLGMLIQWAGAERVVLGSDYPFPMGDLTPVDTLDAVEGLSDDDRGLILGGNVERLLSEVRR